MQARHELRLGFHAKRKAAGHRVQPQQTGRKQMLHILHWEDDSVARDGFIATMIAEQVRLCSKRGCDQQKGNRQNKLLHTELHLTDYGCPARSS